MGAAIIGVRHPCDETCRLQPIEQADERHRRDVENLSEGGLIDAVVPREMKEDRASCASHAWEQGAHFPIIAPAPQPGRLMQQPCERTKIVRVGIIPGLDRPGGHGLQKQAGGRFVGMVATHKQLHDRFGQQLIKRWFVGGEAGRRRAWGCGAGWSGRAPDIAVSCFACHRYSNTMCWSPSPPAGAFRKTMSSGITASVAIINSW